MENNKQNTEGFIPPHGGYRNLITYQKSEIIYEAQCILLKGFLGNMTAQLTR